MRNEPVYRRRRLGALVILVLVIVLIVWAVASIAGGGSSSKAKSSAAVKGTTAGSSTATDSSGNADPTAGGGETAPGSTTPTACPAAMLKLSIAAPNSTVSVGSTVKFAVSMTSTSVQPCLVDGSDTSRVVTITSGKERIWSSADCAAKGARSLLMSKDDVDTKTVSWKTERSEPGCSTDQPTLRPGTYKVQVSLGDATSEQLVLVLK